MNTATADKRREIVTVNLPSSESTQYIDGADACMIAQLADGTRTVYTCVDGHLRMVSVRRIARQWCAVFHTRDSWPSDLDYRSVPCTTREEAAALIAPIATEILGIYLDRNGHDGRKPLCSRV